MSCWEFLSLLGSLAVTGPLGVAIAIWLLAGKSWRLTLSWLTLFGLGMALVVLTKVAFIGWGVGVAALDFAGFSGHAMRSAAVFPVGAFLLARHAGSRAQPLALGLGLMLALLIAVARVKVQAHSVTEAVTGCVLGLLIAAAFIWHARGEQHLALSRVLVVFSMPVLLLAPRLEPLPTEAWMTRLALYLSGHPQPYTRAHWQLPHQRSVLR